MDNRARGRSGCGCMSVHYPGRTSIRLHDEFNHLGTNIAYTSGHGIHEVDIEPLPLAIRRQMRKLAMAS
jgi:hypothetical protein